MAILGLEKNGSTEHAEDRTNCMQDDICHGPESARHEYLVPLQQGTSGDRYAKRRCNSDWTRLDIIKRRYAEERQQRIGQDMQQFLQWRRCCRDQPNENRDSSPRLAGYDRDSDDENQDGQSHGKADSELDVHCGLCLRLKNRPVPFINPD